ncbi:hypothetical protein OE88DRAFT_1740446 [Heliocybe sulcata]|uniref:Uncharacterized protein n=1 Tax=Heliocybe sulcata TaxID=5364 RepID=A0A5C3MIR1_9AGAM|nr:hypothetical protein OE88DRAFT_1740446 [Heliocybe sulcata]
MASSLTLTSMDDRSIMEMRGPAVDWLGPGDRVTIDGIEYEYADSTTSDESVEDAVGPGRTVGKLVKRIAAPIELFLSYCSDLVGQGPDATFIKLMCSKERMRPKPGRRKRLAYWTNHLEEWPHWCCHSEFRVKAIRGLVDLSIDRRYEFPVRLTAAYYLQLLLASGNPYVVRSFIPELLEVLLRICQEGSRRGCAPAVLRPLYETIIGKDDIVRIFNCEDSELRQVIANMQDPSPCSMLICMRRLRLGQLRRSTLDMADRALETYARSSKEQPSDETSFEAALRMVLPVYHADLKLYLAENKEEVDLD